MQKGSKHTAEARAKISAGQAAAWARAPNKDRRGWLTSESGKQARPDLSARNKEMWADPFQRAQRIKAMRDAWAARKPVQPTYYVRHPDDTYSVADPQPRLVKR